MLSGRVDMDSLAPATNARTSKTRTRPEARSSPALRALGVVGLVGVPASVLAVAGGAAGEPTQYVPARSGGWPGWLSGPLHGLGLGIGSNSFQALTLVMCASYVAVLLATRALPMRAIVASILLANVVLLLGPPLLSQDVFGYLAFARMGVLHGLDPYTHVAAEAPTDAVFAFIGWPFQNSPYGPLFTLGTYPLAPLGLGGGLWALKAVGVLASLGAVWLTARAASKMGGSAKYAAAFVGLNPVLLELAVGGAHNDTLVLLVLAGALLLAAERATASKHAPAAQTGRAGSHMSAAAALMIVGVGVKASAGLVLPFLVLAPRRWSERARVLGGAFGAVVVLAIVAVVGFGAQALGFVGALNEQQQLIATHSVPAETARWLGMSATPGWWREVFVGAFAAVTALALWRTARGADWRAMAGWTTLALLLSTAWLLPWYAIWVLPLAALADSRRLRGATLVFCAYAILIHLPLADPLLSPTRHVAHRKLAHHSGAGGVACGRVCSKPAVGDDVVFAGLQVTRDATSDLSRRGVGT